MAIMSAKGCRSFSSAPLLSPTSPPIRILLLLLLLLLSPAIITTAGAASPRGEPFGLRISCGARVDTRTPVSNTLWYRDFGYTGGRIANASLPSSIAPPLKTLRYFPLSDGPENCYLLNNIRPGHYQVRVFFALIAGTKTQSEPLFDVSVGGTLIHTMKSGWSTADDQSFAEATMFVSRDGSLSYCFHSTGHGDPSILSLELLQIDDNGYNFGPPWGSGTVLKTVKRLTCGSGKPAFDSDLNGNHWGGNRYWDPIKTFNQGSDQSISTESSITLAGVGPNFYSDKLYQSAIVGTEIHPDITFAVDAEPRKTYSIWLHFAEIDPRIVKPGMRVFDVLVNGDVAFGGLDIMNVTGKPNAALVLNKTIEVTGKSLTVTFRASKGSHAIINAIEVFEVIPAENTTASDEVAALQILKYKLGLPLRFGWNGDPCVPQQHPWTGVDCQFDSGSQKWVIDGLGLDNQGLRGFLPDDISKLHHLQSINLSGNSIHGTIPYTIGTIPELEILDLSFNMLNGSIPVSLGQLTMLHTLNLNGNRLSGRVPSALGGRPLHRASFNFTGNAGLCGIPGLPSCGPHLSVGAKIGVALGALVVLLLIVTCMICWWKRRQNILRTQKIAGASNAPYAAARTNKGREAQMTRHQRSHDKPRAQDSEPSLLS